MTTAESSNKLLNEKQAIKRFSALICFLRGEISLSELRIKIGKLLPVKLVKLCDSSSGYMPKLTQEGLGKHLGCTYAAVQTWERGKKPSFPRLITFIKIAKFCNLTINDLTELLFDFSDEEVKIEQSEKIEEVIPFAETEEDNPFAEILNDLAEANFMTEEKFLARARKSQPQ